MNGSSLLNRLSRSVPSLIGLFFLGVAVAVIGQELQKYPPAEIIASLSATPSANLAIAAVLTFLNYLMLTGYDTLATHYIKHPLGYHRTAFASVLSYAISNGVGLPLLSSSAIRYRLYKGWGFSSLEIAQVIAFCNMSFYLGLLAIGGVLFTFQPLQVPEGLPLPFESVRPLGLAFLGVVGTYLGWNACNTQPIKVGRFTLPHMPVGFAATLIGVTALDWALTAAIIYALLPSPDAVPFLHFLGVYLLAQIAGLISNVPGGLGVFETVFLFMLSPEVSSASLLGALLGFRILYHFLPLVTGVGALGLYEVRQRLLRRA
jgi:uncharacterized membrane protein YbhN (UPF0104 family)